MKPAARKVKDSTSISGLSYEMTHGRRPGEIAVTFRHGAAFDSFVLANGVATWVDCSDRATMPANVAAHCRRFAVQAAAKMTGRKATGKGAGMGWAA